MPRTRSLKKRGYVYVLANATTPNVAKVGMTQRDDPVVRAKELSGPTGVSGFWGVVFNLRFQNAAHAERNVHERLNTHRLGDDEFFRVPSRKAVEAVLREAAADRERNTFGDLFAAQLEAESEAPTLSLNERASNPWEGFTNIVVELDQKLKALDPAPDGLLMGIIHDLFWQRGLSPIRWLRENEKLAATLAPLSDRTDLSGELKGQLEFSIARLKNRPSDPPLPL